MAGHAQSVGEIQKIHRRRIMKLISVCIKKSAMAVAIVSLLSSGSSFGQFCGSGGCGTMGIGAKEFETNFCDTETPTCSKIVYSIEKGRCSSSGPSSVTCSSFLISIGVTYYPGSCTANGCSYGVGQQRPNELDCAYVNGTCTGGGQ